MSSYLSTKQSVKSERVSRFLLSLIFIGLLLPLSAFEVKSQPKSEKNEKIRLSSESATLNPATTVLAVDARLSKGKGASLKTNTPAAIKGERAEPDMVFTIQPASAGRFVMKTYARTNPEGVELMKRASGKYESLFIRIQIDDNRPTNRVVYVPWDEPLQTSGKFDLGNRPHQIKIWLPRGINFDWLEFSTYVPPKAPAKAEAYVPKIVPPKTHPRLWVNQETLPIVKSRVMADENATAWAVVKKSALTPFVFKFDPTEEMPHNEALELAAERKAFYYLMTGDEAIGREAVKLIDDYLSHVEFGNILDVTRELGRAIYTSSLVYDWCYSLMQPQQKERMHLSLIRLADDMEIGWPPFLEPIVYGHGNEAQICRDLLSMSIAIYDENPIPYKYTSYAVLEQLVPMRKFQYQSARHNQGVNYGTYRLGWDMHAAWLFYGMNGQKVFDSNIETVFDQFLYMRTPDGQMLKDGDSSGKSPTANKDNYWSSPLTMLLGYAYTSNPILKADFIRQGGLPDSPVLYLLLNNPNLKPAENRDSLPLTKDFGPILGGMVARTGWEFGKKSDDVVAEIKGGGYQFANHQHSDAGAIQLYYRGFQFGDIGLYKFYGTPYDMNFNKRSISHSMMLAVDPNEKFATLNSNDGGTRSVRVNPATPEQVLNDPLFYNGKVLSTDFGPSELKPDFSYFSVDLKGAYSSKITAYNRSFCFLNLGRKDVPAAIIIADDMTTSDPSFKKYWQINSTNEPEFENDRIVFHAEQNGRTGKTFMNMLVPDKTEREISILSGADAVSTFFNLKYPVPVSNMPESLPSRTLISPIKAKANDRFVTVFQVTDGKTPPLPIEHHTITDAYMIVLADRVVTIPTSTKFIDKSFSISVPKNKQTYQVLLTGIKPGDWTIVEKKSNLKNKVSVLEGKNTAFFNAKPGEYLISPELTKDGKTISVYPNPVKNGFINIEISGLKGMQLLEFYDLAGNKALADKVEFVNGIAVYNTAALKRGAYILKTNNKTAKIVLE